MLNALTASDVKVHLVGLSGHHRSELERSLKERASDFAVFKTLKEYDQYASAAYRPGEPLTKPEVLVLEGSDEVRAKIAALSKGSANNVKAVLLFSKDSRRDMSNLHRLARSDFQILAVDQAAKPEAIFHSLDALIQRVVPLGTPCVPVWGNERPTV